MSTPDDIDSLDHSVKGTRPIYVVRIPKAELKELQCSKKFILILRLCRYRNQLLYCARSYLDYGYDTSPQGQRHRFNSVWFLCGVLNEAVRIIPELGKEFRHFPSFKEGFEGFLRDKKLMAIRARLLAPLRNQLVFHVDNAAIEKSLFTLDVDTFEFVTQWSGDHMGIFYNLADEVVLNAFIESDEESSQKEWPFEELLGEVLAFMRHFSHCADGLIHEYMTRKGWTSVEDSKFFEPKAEDDLGEFVDYMVDKHGV